MEKHGGRVQVVRKAADKGARGKGRFAVRSWQTHGAYQAGHLPEAELDVTMTRSELLEVSPYSAIAESLFGMASFGFALRRSFFNESPNPLGFHQDGFFSDYGYNFWTPLNDAGISSANLEVIIASGAPLFSHSAIADSTIVDQYLYQKYPREQFWHPIIRAGDSLVFSTFMFHRTRQTPEMTRERYSIEIRGPITASVKIKGVPADPGAALRLSSITELPAFVAQAQ